MAGASIALSSRWSLQTSAGGRRDSTPSWVQEPVPPSTGTCTVAVRNLASPPLGKLVAPPPRHSVTRVAEPGLRCWSHQRLAPAVVAAAHGHELPGRHYVGDVDVPSGPPLYMPAVGRWGIPVCLDSRSASRLWRRCSLISDLVAPL